MSEYESKLDCLADKNIVLGITGGIACYKSAEIVSLLVKRGANVFVVMTRNAAEFISPLTFQTLSGNPVSMDMFAPITNWEIEHIALAKKADAFLIAPATANFIGKVAGGISDDLLTTTVMATKSKVFIAPAMNTNMYENLIVKENINNLEGLGYSFIGPDEGRLACGDVGAGKMTSPAEIVGALEEYFSEDLSLKGKRILVTAGPTIEPLDPFRYITNHSSGKMGYALAAEALKLGAKVKLISGPVSLKPIPGVETVYIKTAEEMKEEVISDGDFHMLIKAAAVSDFRPEKASDIKIKKTDPAAQDIHLVRNPDILKCVSGLKGEGKAFKNTYLVGFAAETDDVVSYARRKRIDKGLDMIVANDISKEGTGFKSDDNSVTIITKDYEEELKTAPKREIARAILLKAAEEMNKCSQR